MNPRAVEVHDLRERAVTEEDIALEDLNFVLECLQASQDFMEVIEVCAGRGLGLQIARVAITAARRKLDQERSVS